MPGLTIGDTIPNLLVSSTHGPIQLHEFVGHGWAILFSHFADFTPVCTTELGKMALYGDEFEKRGVKLLGFSCDDVPSHVEWIKDIEAYTKTTQVCQQKAQALLCFTAPWLSSDIIRSNTPCAVYRRVHSPSLLALPPLMLDQELLSDALGDDDLQAAAVLCLALLLHLFWFCATGADFLFFRALDAPLEQALGCRLALRGVLLALGPDVEERFMRSLGYMLTKWCILRELQGGAARHLFPTVFCPFYLAERHGLWFLKGFAPVPAMTWCGACGSTSGANLEATKKKKKK